MKNTVTNSPPLFFNLKRQNWPSIYHFFIAISSGFNIFPWGKINAMLHSRSAVVCMTFIKVMGKTTLYNEKNRYFPTQTGVSAWMYFWS